MLIADLPKYSDPVSYYALAPLLFLAIIVCSNYIAKRAKQVFKAVHSKVMKLK